MAWSFRVARFFSGTCKHTAPAKLKDVQPWLEGSPLSPPLLSRTFVDRRTDCFRPLWRQFSFCHSENCWKVFVTPSLLPRSVCPRIVPNLQERKALSGKSFETVDTMNFPRNMFFKILPFFFFYIYIWNINFLWTFFKDCIDRWNFSFSLYIYTVIILYKNWLCCTRMFSLAYISLFFSLNKRHISCRKNFLWSHH